MYKMIDYLYRHKFFPLFGSGKNLMQPVLAQDLANAYYQVLMKRETTINREYDLSGREPISYLDLVRTVSHALDRRNVILPLPMWLSLLSIRAYNAISKRPQITVEQVMRMNEDKVFPHEAATLDFGYNPESFRDGIRGEVEDTYGRGNCTHDLFPTPKDLPERAVRGDAMAYNAPPCGAALQAVRRGSGKPMTVPLLAYAGSDCRHSNFGCELSAGISCG